MAMVKWNDSVAITCRYGDIVGEALGYPDVIWEHSENDYQGFANFIGKMKDGRFVHYEWTYGSCSGCDEWEAENYSDEELKKIILDSAAFFADVDTVKRYLRLEGEFKNSKVPSANTATNESIPGMMRYIGGGISDDFRDMGVAFIEWVQTNNR